MFRKIKEIHAITSPFLLILKKRSKDRRISMNFLKLHMTVTLSTLSPNYNPYSGGVGVVRLQSVRLTASVIFELAKFPTLTEHAIQLSRSP